MLSLLVFNVVLSFWIDLLKINFLIVIELKVIQRTFSTIQDILWLGHRETSRWLLVLLLEIDIFLSEHE